MKILIIIFSIMLQGCAGLGIFNETVKTGSEAIVNVKKADAIQSVGQATKILAKSKIKKEETKQLKIKENANALEIAVGVLNQIKDEKQKVVIAGKLLKARVERVADEQKTIRVKYYTNSWLWIVTVLLGVFVFLALLKSLAGVGSRVEGNFKINKKEI